MLEVGLPVFSHTSVVYAAYEMGVLRRVMLVNLQAWNVTMAANPSSSVKAARPLAVYDFAAPSSCAGNASVARLSAPGSDSVTGATWGGMAYEYAPSLGKPVAAGNDSKGEIVPVSKEGVFEVNVPWSSAAMVSLNCTGGTGS